MKKNILVLLVLLLAFSFGCQKADGSSDDTTDASTAKIEKYWACVVGGFSKEDAAKHLYDIPMKKAVDSSERKESLKGTTHTVKVGDQTATFPYFSTWRSSSTHREYDVYLDPDLGLVQVGEDGKYSRLSFDEERFSKESSACLTKEELLEKARSYVQEISQEDVTKYQVEEVREWDTHVVFCFYKIDERAKYLENVEVGVFLNGLLYRYSATEGFGELTGNVDFDYLSVYNAVDAILTSLSNHCGEEKTFCIVSSEMILSPELKPGIRFRVQATERFSGNITMRFDIDVYKEPLPEAYWEYAKESAD